jgi:prepilin-type N-terminal cleavage/methylation domain-containing protein
MGNDRRIERRSSGFTLIELLAVIIILSILAFFLLTNLTDVLGTTDVQVTKITAQKISAALHELANDNGDFAPSSLPSDLGAPPNMDNLGSESLYVALLADGKPGFGLFDENISNTDDDALARRAPGFEVPTLFELCDRWGNPFAYFHWRDYGREDKYQTLNPETGEAMVSNARAQKNPDTGQYFEPRAFQLISAGPDGEFGTEDDIANFKIKKE